MANTIQITDGTTTYDLLTATDYRIRYGSVATPPPPMAVTWAGSRRRDGTFPGFSHFDNRQITLMLMVEGTTVDDLEDNFTNFDKMLQETLRYFESSGAQAKKARLTVKLDGATNTTEYVVLSGEIDAGNWATVLTTRAFRLFCPVTFWCQPFGEENADVTASWANLTNADVSVRSTSPRGVRKTPAKISLTVDQAVTNPRFWFARRTRGTVANFINLLRGEVTGGTGYSVTDITDGNSTYATTAGGATEENASFGRLTFTAGGVASGRDVRWRITSNFADHYGQFRVWARMRNNVNPERWLTLYYGAQQTPTKTSVLRQNDNPTIATWHMVDLGVITWPDMTVPAGVAVSTLDLDLEVASGTSTTQTITDTTDIDYILLVPIDEGYITGTFAAAFNISDKLIIDGSAFPPQVYVLTTADALRVDLPPASVAGTFPDLAPGTNRIFFYLGNPAADVLADTIDVSVTYRPRYNWLRGT